MNNPALKSLVACLLLGASAATGAKPLWQHQTPGNPPLSLAALPGPASNGPSALLAGYDSGAVTCYSATSPTHFQALWSTRLNGCVLDLQVIGDVNADGFPDVVAATDTGLVACLSAGGPSAGKVLWRVESVFNISQLLILEDANGDGVSEVAFGGADHRVHLLHGATGSPLWARLFEGEGETKYVDALANAGDLNGDGRSDLFIRTWSGHRWAISGTDGSNIWNPGAGSPYLSTLVTTTDLNGDKLSEFLFSGNNGVLVLGNGKDGGELWRSELGSPIRALAAAPRLSSNRAFHCFAGTAQGKVFCAAGQDAKTLAVRWTGELGDVCRKLITLELDQDATPDVIAGAENGLVAAFSGVDGKLLWQWQGKDVVRTLAKMGDVDGDGVPDLAAGLLDGTLVILPGLPKPSSIETSKKVTQSKPKKETVQAAVGAGMARPRVFSTGAVSTGTSRPRPDRASMPSEQSGKKNSNPLPSPEVTEIPILLYHDIPPQGIQAGDSSPLANFREQMDLLVAGRYTAVSLEDIAEWIEGKRLLPTRPVCITFDGHYASHLTHVAKILEERGLFAISYITTDWIGTGNHLDWHQLRRLEQSGAMRIENHTINHRYLPRSSQDEVARQLNGCKASLRRHLDGKESKHHAYPNGGYNSMVRDVLRDSGYRTATTVLSRRAVRTDRVFQLPRYAISEDMSLASFKMIIGYQPPPYPALPYKLAGTVGTRWQQPSFGEVDAEGKLWVCDVSGNCVRVFLPDGTEASFSPITQGLAQKGTSMPIRTPAGIAISPDGDALISISSRFEVVKHSGLFRYRASDGKVAPGLDLPYFPGDLDTDAQGLLYVADKLTEQWHLYTADGKEISGSPFGQNTGLHVVRGISVTPDGSKVYIISETAHNVRVWQGSATPASAHYRQSSILVNNLSYESSSVDVMNDGTVWVSFHEEGALLAFDAQHRTLGQISGGTPSLSVPRGVAFTPNGNTLWIMSRLGQVQRWEKTAP